jgi:hypothetical protein
MIYKQGLAAEKAPCSSPGPPRPPPRRAVFSVPSVVYGVNICTTELPFHGDVAVTSQNRLAVPASKTGASSCPHIQPLCASLVA